MKTIEQKPAEWLQELEDKLANATHKQLAEWKEKYFEEEPAEWSDEDETGLTNTIIMLKEGASLHFNKKDIEKAVDWLRTLKDRILPQPKQEWKQENTGDLTDFENAMMHIGDSFFGENAGLDPNDTNVVKEQANFLLELVPSKEWSEEDEENFARVDYACLKVYGGDSYSSDWLRKFLGIHKKWKPSDEQMDALETAVSSLQSTALESLYNELKKL